ncbi:TetR/AcrR family transcriptional regulator [Clostridium sp. YIM B02515]|uniref:TetR/AcrR family transcriptional regulator n=1 Tax=Clostridium rhizosphaerae TaxID=2803861 RepID=A0ABS1TCH1_9CLOT|nr:TetR/AcrR family transcriptional regulator [Clostridium rhizosphaerae]MBL4937064.1 TetR/AcrR family transcriptional regulator [Clostridium rhizosphaerae]
MTIEKRREREKEEMKELILSAASDIIAIEGFDKLSIRKIAKKIEYSPAIIYHYFNDKEEILNNVMQRGYKKIISAVSSTEMKNTSPEERLVEMTRNYIEAALNMPDEFMAAQLNKSNEALKHTSWLFKGASKEKLALSELCQCLQDIYKDKEADENTIELTAQMIAVSTLGLIMKLTVERNLVEEQRQRLIDFYSKEIVLRIANGNKIK